MVGFCKSGHNLLCFSKGSYSTLLISYAISQCFDNNGEYQLDDMDLNLLRTNQITQLHNHVLCI